MRIQEDPAAAAMLETMIQVLPMRENEVLEQFARVLGRRMAAGSGAVLDECQRNISGWSDFGGNCEKYIDRGAAISIVYPRKEPAQWQTDAR